MAYKRNFSSMDFDFKVGWGRFTIWGKGGQSERQNSNNVTLCFQVWCTSCKSILQTTALYKSLRNLLLVLYYLATDIQIADVFKA